MPKGKFPYEQKPRPGQPPPDPVEVEKQMQGERRLAYVALTRAAKNLTVVCPSVVGGKAAGVSPFVAEAKLRPGENVTPATPKTASEGYEGAIPDDWANDRPLSYDRSAS